MTDLASPVAAILLAAGNSERMGRPKPLLEWRGRTFLERQIRVYRSAGCAVYVVLGHDADRIAASCAPISKAVRLSNPNPERGMLSSLKIAVSALPAATPALFFTPVDNPGVRPQTLASMLSLWRERKPAYVMPCYYGRRGHPILLDGSLIENLLKWPDSSTPREFLRRHVLWCEYADLVDPLITVDLDTAQEYEAFLREHPER